MSRDRVWCYNECNQEDLQLITEAKILEQRWEWWSGKMRELGRDESMITEDECIADWAVIYWAWPLVKTGEK